jgi:hypothetical protein
MSDEDGWPWNNLVFILNLIVQEHSQFSERSGYQHAKKVPIPAIYYKKCDDYCSVS